MLKIGQARLVADAGIAEQLHPTVKAVKSFMEENLDGLPLSLSRISSTVVERHKRRLTNFPEVVFTSPAYVIIAIYVSERETWSSCSCP
jgi:hypothetical protein